MASPELRCPYAWDHPGKERPKVLALQISDRAPNRRIGGLRLSGRAVSGVDVHCPACHLEGWVAMPAGWTLESWDGPKRCSCGETTR